MNEKIKELMTKCNYVVDGTCDTSREQKFAELIVQECIHVALRDALPTWDNAAPETCEQCVKIAADLKEHFGV